MKERTESQAALARLERELGAARSYAEWREIAGEHDRLSGAAAWRADDATDLLHVPEIRKSIATLRTMREAGETWPLTKKLQEVLFRHQGEFIHPELYQVAKTGTKQVVTDFLDEVEACLHYLLTLEVKGVGDEYKLEQLKRVGRVYGRPALMLSGGGALGIYHFGVVKALFERDLLPRTISGSSMGAIIAAWACCHDDEALRHFFANPHLVELDALNRLPLKKMLAQRALFDQAWMLDYLRALIPDLTFAESMKLSRRILNISVSPHKAIQSPRLLNFLSSPEALGPSGGARLLRDHRCLQAGPADGAPAWQGRAVDGRRAMAGRLGEQRPALRATGADPQHQPFHHLAGQSAHRALHVAGGRPQARRRRHRAGGRQHRHAQFGGDSRRRPQARAQPPAPPRTRHRARA